MPGLHDIINLPQSTSPPAVGSNTDALMIIIIKIIIISVVVFNYGLKLGSKLKKWLRKVTEI